MYKHLTSFQAVAWQISTLPCVKEGLHASNDLGCIPSGGVREAARDLEETL